MFGAMLAGDSHTTMGRAVPPPEPRAVKAGAALAANTAAMSSTTVTNTIKRLMGCLLLPPATQHPEHIRVFGEAQHSAQGIPPVCRALRLSVAFRAG